MLHVRGNVHVTDGCVCLQLGLNSVKRLMIDCEQTPDNVLRSAIDYTKLKCKAPQSNSFDEWIFDYSEDVSSDEWNKILPVLVVNLHRLHDLGQIRYAEWTPRIR